jgi:SpoVK/Ycf46/Vps4 family AAA+-type ATPase
MEDIDALVHRYGENEFLALLDGEAQVDRICFVATTNYPERLDKRFVDRPSRFDTIKYVGMPTAAARRLYLQNREPDLGDDLEAWVRLSDGFSIAHLKEMIIAVRCLGQDLDDVVERLESLRTSKADSARAPDSQSFGFAGIAKSDAARIGVKGRIY